MDADPIAILGPHQVWDGGRGCFMVKMEATPERHLGEVVYRDAFGKRFIITSVRPKMRWPVPAIIGVQGRG